MYVIGKSFTLPLAKKSFLPICGLYEVVRRKSCIGADINLGLLSILSPKPTF